MLCFSKGMKMAKNLAEQQNEPFDTWLKQKGNVVTKVRDGKSSMPAFENKSVGSLNLSRPISSHDEKKK